MSAINIHKLLQLVEGKLFLHFFQKRLGKVLEYFFKNFNNL